MATYTADQFIGKTLVAQKNVTAFYGGPGSKNIFVIFKGQNIGVVYAWVIKNTPDHKLWWQFQDKNGIFYFVPGDPNYVGMNEYDKKTIPSVEQKVQAEKDKAKKDEDGKVLYYIQKWGKKILIGGAITYVVVQGIKTAIHEQSNRRTKE